MQNAQKFFSTILGNADGTPAPVDSKQTAIGIFTVSNSFKHAVAVTVSWQKAWIVAFKLQYFWSPDGNTFFEDRRLGSSSHWVWGKYGSLNYMYLPPDATEKVKIVVTNKNSFPISVLSMGCKLENSPSEP